MKYFASICILFVLTSADYVVKSPSDLLQYHQECVDKLKMPPISLELYKKWEFPNDAQTQCYIKCLYMKFDIFDEDDGFNMENIHQQLISGEAQTEHDDEFHAKIVGCIDTNEQSSNTCEWAYRGAQCFFKQNLQLVKESVKPL